MRRPPVAISARRRRPLWNQWGRQPPPSVRRVPLGKGAMQPRVPCSRCRRLGMECRPPPTVPRGRPAPLPASQLKTHIEKTGQAEPGATALPDHVQKHRLLEAAQSEQRKVEALRAQLVQLGVQPCV